MSELSAEFARIEGAQAQAEVFYPESDGKPMGETDYHIAALLYLWQSLRFYYRHEPLVYVAGDMLFYYEEGNPAEVKVPDVFVVKGIAKHNRRVYKLWEEGVAPCVVFEITSRSTRLEDQGTKRALYEMLGVQEYFLFDPLEEYLRPRLQGLRLTQGSYRKMPLLDDGTLISHELALVLHPVGTLLRLLNPDTGQFLPTMDEAVDLMDEALERARVARQQADVEARRAKAETRRAETQAQRAEAEAARAEAEAARAEAEAARAEAEAARADRLAHELEELKRRLGI